MRRLRCGEVWGGVRNLDSDVCTAGITASLYSGASDGGKGGDIYYFSVCQGDMLTRIAIADVVGHGEAVSDVSSWLYDALHAHMNDGGGDEILSDLNGLACDCGYKAITTAAVIGYYTADQHAYLAYAGHHAALIRRRANGVWTAATLDAANDGLANLPLGVDRSVVFSQERTPLRTGDRLFLYTDGVIEAPNPDGELFEEHRLLSTLRDAADAPLSEMKAAVLRALREHTGGALSHDDVTLFAIEVN